MQAPRFCVRRLFFSLEVFMKKSEMTRRRFLATGIGALALTGSGRNLASGLPPRGTLSIAFILSQVPRRSIVKLS